MGIIINTYIIGFNVPFKFLVMVDNPGPTLIEGSPGGFLNCLYFQLIMAPP